jgi:hypothetical protein
MPALKRGAGPNSPRLTALVSSVATQAFDPAPDQRPRRRHRHAGHLARYDQHAAVGDGAKRLVD